MEKDTIWFWLYFKGGIPRIWPVAAPLLPTNNVHAKMLVIYTIMDNLFVIELAC